MIKTLEWTDAGVLLHRPDEAADGRGVRHLQELRRSGGRHPHHDCARRAGDRRRGRYGCGAWEHEQAQATALPEFEREFDAICDVLAGTRPTAVNLFWAIRRMRDKFEQLRTLPVNEIKAGLVAEAQRMHVEDIAANEAMGKHGAVLLPASGGVLTHCNAGALATAGYGTALGVIRAAVASGKQISVFADETRPFLQGSRLTAWELMKDGIPTTLIADNMAGAMMRLGKIDAVIVGADRIAANGDVANKIGTYSVAVLAKEHGIPFYVAAPISTVDLNTPDGSKIPIEQRASTEVTHLAGKQIAPDDVRVENPAFDVTPSRYVTAIITERGVARAPYQDSLADLVGKT